MTIVTNLAFSAFLRQLGSELAWGQVLIVRNEEGFEMRHVDDREVPASSLKLVSSTEVRALAQFNQAGQFRPLRAAPDLRRGWRTVVTKDQAFEVALQNLYPGGVADWYAAQQSAPPITHYREFTARQTGMYKTTNQLDDEQASAMARAGCHEMFCLKRRLWTVGKLQIDDANEKSLIPCLEPCAVILEFARYAFRYDQPNPSQMNLDSDDVPPREQREMAAIRVADFSDPRNPRRIQLLTEKERCRSKVPLSVCP